MGERNAWYLVLVVTVHVPRYSIICIDLIGPYKIGTEKKPNTIVRLYYLTMIDPVTEWFEIAEIPEKTADEVINVLEMARLVRYPRPTEIIMDCGSEFRAEVESTLHEHYGIRIKRITTRNP
jgi:hypothetical protein